MNGLVTPGLCLESYANVTKLDVVSRNDVYTATLDGDPCILKSYDLTNQADRRRVEREVLRLQDFRHRHIVAVDAVFVESNMKAYVQMPEYKGGNLRQWLLAGTPDSQKRQRLIYGLLQAVERIHACRVTHNDMKLENVLLTEGAEDAVLSDFELSHTTGGATTTVVGGAIV
jgi:serine/threonine protein kinase